MFVYHIFASQKTFEHLTYLILIISKSNAMINSILLLSQLAFGEDKLE